MAPKSMKLIYFDARGRAEILRLLLAAAGQEFEDVRISQQDWPGEKATMPFGQLPCLEIDGQRYGQTIALANYLAREFGLYGKSHHDALEIDQVVQLTQDYTAQVIKAFYEPDEAKRAEFLKNLKEVQMPTYLSYYETLLQDKGNKGHFVGSTLTLGDLVVFDIVDTMKVREIGTIDACPAIQKLLQNVESNDKMTTYLQHRKSAI